MPDTIIVVPTYNERENISKLVPVLLDIGPDIGLLVVDDNSPDGTAEYVESVAAANPRVELLRRPEKMGLGSAYITGFKEALRRGATYIVQMDADFSHDPNYIQDLLKAMDESDLALGSRYVKGVNVVNWPMHRLLLSYFANVYTRIVIGMPIHDATSGFKCFKREVLEAIKMEEIISDGYCFQIEMTFRAWLRGFRIKEVPIVFVDRHSGSSKMSNRIIREAIWKVWWLRLKALFKQL
ncbi:MAG: polyprenol monophosphomannose synthase [Candidatus Eisenbacteria bacterium]